MVPLILRSVGPYIINHLQQEVVMDNMNKQTEQKEYEKYVKEITPSHNLGKSLSYRRADLYGRAGDYKSVPLDGQ